MWMHWRRRWLGRTFREGSLPRSLPALLATWVALDFETTSLDPALAEIVSIGAVRIRGNRIETGDALAIRVQAPASLSAGSVVIHGLRHQDLQQGMALEPALRALLEFIGPRELVGYHIAYDLRILNLACQRLWGSPCPSAASR